MPREIEEMEVWEWLNSVVLDMEDIKGLIDRVKIGIENDLNENNKKQKETLEYYLQTFVKLSNLIIK